jgi:hypothetical protein
MIPNWTVENSVILAEWIIDAYKYEELALVESVLRNPPKKEDKTGEAGSNWRLTPDTIHAWMAPALERAAITREKAQERFKLEEKNAGPLDKIDYDAFRARLEKTTTIIGGETVEVAKPHEVSKDHWHQDEAYRKYKAQRSTKQALTETQNKDGNEVR